LTEARLHRTRDLQQRRRRQRRHAAPALPFARGGRCCVDRPRARSEHEADVRPAGGLSDLWLPSKGATCSVFRARADEKPLEDPQNCPTERPCAPAHRSPSARLLLAPSGARGAPAMANPSPTPSP